MIATRCVVCMKNCLIPEDERELRMPNISKYWSYNKDKSIRPYCGVDCGLIDYEERIKK